MVSKQLRVPIVCTLLDHCQYSNWRVITILRKTNHDQSKSSDVFWRAVNEKFSNRKGRQQMIRSSQIVTNHKSWNTSRGHHRDTWLMTPPGEQLLMYFPNSSFDVNQGQNSWRKWQDREHEQFCAYHWTGTEYITCTVSLWNIELLVCVATETENKSESNRFNLETFSCQTHLVLECQQRGTTGGLSMGPRMDGHDTNSAPARMIPLTSQIYQRRKESPMDESSSSIFSSSTVHCQAEPSSEDTTKHHRSEFRILMVSESQSSLASQETGPSTNNQSRQSTTSTLSTKRSQLILAWSLHFATCILILLCGIEANQGKRYVKMTCFGKNIIFLLLWFPGPLPTRKYIPLDVNKVEDDCTKAFLDVFSSSMDDPGAFVCCRSTIHVIPTVPMDSTVKNPSICNPPVSRLVWGITTSLFVVIILSFIHTYWLDDLHSHSIFHLHDD